MSRTKPQRQAPGPVIAVLGGGYAGLFAARRAARAITRDSGAAVVLTDSGDAWQERTRWHQIAAGEAIRSRSRARLFRGTRVATVIGTVTGIDLQDRRLTFGDREPLAFDRLVYTAGSRSNAASVPGGAAHAHTLDTPETSRRLAAVIAGRPDCRLLVVGGGLTGIQTAAHIARRHPGIRVTLVSSGTIGDELPGAAQAPVDRALRNLGVEVIEKRRVEAVDAESVRWAGGRIAADVVVWTAGFVPSPLAEQAGLAVTRIGQVEVDAALRSVSHSFVFAAGDGAAVPRASSAYGAYAATATGATAGMNAGRDLAGQPVMPLSMGYSLLAASLGPGNAVVQLLRPDGTPRRQILTGRAGSVLKEMVERYVTFGVSAERNIPGVYHWAPAPRTRNSDATPGL